MAKGGGKRNSDGTVTAATPGRTGRPGGSASPARAGLNAPGIASAGPRIVTTEPKTAVPRKQGA